MTPGAEQDGDFRPSTDFLHRAGMDDTRVGRQEKDDPAQVAKTAMHRHMSEKDPKASHDS